MHLLLYTALFSSLALAAPGSATSHATTVTSTLTAVHHHSKHGGPTSAPHAKHTGTSTCLTDAQATKVAQNFRDLIGEPFNTTLATTALSPDFTDYSDSVIELINSGCPGPFPLGSPTFTNQTAFIKGQSGQKPIPFQILKVWNTCDTVIIRWRSNAPGFVKPEQEVTGIIVFETEVNKNATEKKAEPFLIRTVYSEFNSGAWLVDIGNFTCAASSQQKTPASPPAYRRAVNLPYPA